MAAPLDAQAARQANTQTHCQVIQILAVVVVEPTLKILMPEPVVQELSLSDGLLQRACKQLHLIQIMVQQRLPPKELQVVFPRN